MNFCQGSLAALAIFFALGRSDAVATTFVTLDDPLATLGTFPHKLSGDRIVGNYETSQPPSNHGFEYRISTNTWTTIDVPGSTATYANGISGNTIVGEYFDASNARHGFLFDGVSYQTFDYPSGNSSIKGIDGSQIIGIYYDGFSVGHGYLYDGSAFKTLDAPSATPVRFTVPNDISGNRVVGYFGDSTPPSGHGFLFDGSAWTVLDDPSALKGGTTALGVSGNYVVGNYGDAIGQDHGFILNLATDSWTTVDYPSAATGTVLCGIDGLNVIGAYGDATGNTHGFLALDLVPEPPSITLALTAVIGFLAVWKLKDSSLPPNSFFDPQP